MDVVTNVKIIISFCSTRVTFIFHFTKKQLLKYLLKLTFSTFLKRGSSLAPIRSIKTKIQRNSISDNEFILWTPTTILSAAFKTAESFHNTSKKPYNRNLPITQHTTINYDGNCTGTVALTIPVRPVTVVVCPYHGYRSRRPLIVNHYLITSHRL
jgi:hypothetical protein